MDDSCPGYESPLPHRHETGLCLTHELKSGSLEHHHRGVTWIERSAVSTMTRPCQPLVYKYEVHLEQLFPSPINPTSKQPHNSTTLYTPLLQPKRYHASFLFPPSCPWHHRLHEENRIQEPVEATRPRPRCWRVQSRALKPEHYSGWEEKRKARASSNGELLIPYLSYSVDADGCFRDFCRVGEMKPMFPL